MARMSFVVAVAAALSVGVLSGGTNVAVGDEPAKLSPKELAAAQQEIGRIEKQYNEELAAGDLEKALATIELLRVERLKVLPADHWLIRTVEIQTADLEEITSLPADKRETVAKTIQEWKSLNAKAGPLTIVRLGELSETLRANAGEESFQSLELDCNLAQWLLANRQYLDCRPIAADTVARVGKVLGENHPWYAAALTVLATTDSNLGRWEDASRESALALRANERLWGPEAPPCGMNLISLAWINLNRKDFAAAHRHADRAISVLARYQDNDPINYLTARIHDARALAQLERHEEAEEAYKKTITFLEKHKELPPPFLHGALHEYAQVLTQTGKTQDLKEVRERIAAIEDSAGPTTK
jgi:tetratricopeptide (TPR) repeat protein